jgi:hypothetical protein
MAVRDRYGSGAGDDEMKPVTGAEPGASRAPDVARHRRSDGIFALGWAGWVFGMTSPYLS